MARNEISVNLGELFVTFVTENEYPDIFDDMTNRVRKLTLDIISDLRENGFDLDNLFETPDSDEDEDEDEDA